MSDTVFPRISALTHQINRYPEGKYYDNAIQWIVIYPVDSTIQLSDNLDGPGAYFIQSNNQIKGWVLIQRRPLNQGGAHYFFL